MGVGHTLLKQIGPYRSSDTIFFSPKNSVETKRGKETLNSKKKVHLEGL